MWKHWVPKVLSPQQAILSPMSEGAPTATGAEDGTMWLFISLLVKSKLWPGNPQSLFWQSSWNSKTGFLQFGELMLQLWNIFFLEWSVHRFFPAAESLVHMLLSTRGICANSLVFSVVLMLPPIKKVTLSVDSWVTKGLKCSWKTQVPLCQANLSLPTKHPLESKKTNQRGGMPASCLFAVLMLLTSHRAQSFLLQLRIRFFFFRGRTVLSVGLQEYLSDIRRMSTGNSGQQRQVVRFDPQHDT